MSHLVEAYYLYLGPSRTRLLCLIENVLGENLTHVSSKLWSENTYHWGKYHCMTGLQFYKLGFNCFPTY